LVDAITNPPAIRASPAATTSLVPRRGTTFGDETAATTMAIANGSVRTPACRAEYPFTSCRYCVTRKMNPNSAKNPSVIARLAAVNRMLRKRFTSSSGADTRRSHHENTASRTAAPAIPPIVVAEIQP
jgi:hypothetical protein